MRKIDSNITFKVQINPFLRKVIITSVINFCEFTHEMFYEDLDEWNYFSMGDLEFDIHFLYDESFSVSIYPVFDDKVDTSQNYDVKLEIVLKD